MIAAGGEAFAIQADIAEPDDVASLVHGSVSHFGRIDTLVANAAASAFKPLADIRRDHVRKTMAITVEGFLDLVAAATPHMPPGGRVVAISGWDTFRVLPGHGLLGAAKAAMETLVKYLAIELGQHGITTVGLCPGPIVETDSFRYYVGDDFDLFEKTWRAWTPSGEFTSAAAIAEAMAFLCSSRSAAINGQTIVIDGGLSLATMPISRVS